MMPRRSCHEDEKAVIQSSMNLKVLTYDAKNNHAELGSSIEQLTQWVDAQRQSLAASLGW